MDIKRTRSSFIGKPSTTSFGDTRNNSLSTLNWDLYHQQLVKHNIKQNARRWYVFRVEALLKAYPEKPLADLSVDDIGKFLQILTQDSSLTDWQVLQAIDAIQILCMEVLDRNHFVQVNWDDYRLSVKTIEPNHATLARETLPSDEDKTTLLSRSKGHLAEVFAEYQEEMEMFLLEVRARQYSIRTEQSYEQWILRLLARHRGKSTQYLTGEHIKAFINDLVVRGNVSASTRNQALSALLFFYRHVLNKEPDQLGDIAHAKRPKRLPVVLTREEMHALLGQLHGTTWLVAALLYGAGLRLMECVRLRVMDIDFCREPLKKHLAEVKVQHDTDLEQGYGEVFLPDAFSRKNPAAAGEWRWQYVFPATRLSIDPRSGQTR